MTATSLRQSPILRQEAVMGTVVSFEIRPGSLAVTDVYLAMAEARSSLHRADAVFSTWKPNSPISRLRGGEIDIDDCPDDVRDVTELCRAARDRTGGWFDPWAAPGGIDPSGLVKGWAAARALSVLRAAGIDSAIVNAGGDIATAGRPETPDGRYWQIGIRDPWDPMSTVARVAVQGAVATSGTYERGEHVFNPFTGRWASAVASASVTGPDLSLADAVATALVAGGEEALAATDLSGGYEALLIRPDRSAIMTEGFPLVL